MSETQANAAKAKTDALAADLLDLDQDDLRKDATKIASYIRTHFKPLKNVRVVVAGGAGSGKTTIASALSKELELPAFDLDEFIKGGFTSDKEKYRRRFLKAIHDVWTDMPSGKGWVLDHVESCSPDLLSYLKPHYAILLKPNQERLRLTARARNMVSEDPWPGREKRALESASLAEKQFDEANGSLGTRGKTWVLKHLNEG